MLIRRALKDAGSPELAHYDEGREALPGKVVCKQIRCIK